MKVTSFNRSLVLFTFLFSKKPRQEVTYVCHVWLLPTRAAAPPAGQEGEVHVRLTGKLSRAINTLSMLLPNLYV